MEKTYVMLKPDAIERGLMGAIIARIEQKGFKISRMELKELDEPLLRIHYAHVAEKPFFPEMVRYMTRGPVLAMIVEGEGVIAALRRIIGATKTEEAQPGTIRGDFTHSTTENLIHASDAPETAQEEIKRFFG